MPKHVASFNVHRPVFQQEELATRRSSRDSNYVRRSCKSFSLKVFLLSTFPIIEWFSEYRFKTDFLPDLIAGVTVTILQIPQGMAYALLANIPPVFGIYTAIFPVFAYVIFGSSRHVNLGTFSIVCLATGKTVSAYSDLDHNRQPLRSDSNQNSEQFTNVEVLSAITFTVALFQILMYICRLGILCILLSDALINGFTTACAIHLVITQLKDLFGLPIKSKHEYFRNVVILYNSMLALPHANYMAVSISALVLVVLFTNDLFLKPWLIKKCPLPFPMELLVVAIATLISYFTDLSNKFSVTIIGEIPVGLPTPMIPVFAIIPRIAFDCVSICIISYVITISVESIFAKKASYDLFPNQELLATGLCNLVGSFLMCIPISASLTRSIVQYQVGGQSQITLLVSSVLLICILLWVAPVFSYLPRCVLASIIIAAISKFFLQARELKKFWLLSKLDALIWIVTFATVVFVDIGIGLIAGIGLSIIVLCIHSFRPNACLLGAVQGTEMYLELRKYEMAKEIEGLKIYHYRGGISFASRQMYRSELVKCIDIDAKKILIDRRKQRKKLQPSESLEPIDLPVKCIILDFATVTFVDPSAVQFLRDLEHEYAEVGIIIILCSVSAKIFEMLQKCDSLEYTDHSFMIFPTIHDGVLYAKGLILKQLK